MLSCNAHPFQHAAAIACAGVLVAALVGAQPATARQAAAGAPTEQQQERQRSVSTAATPPIAAGFSASVEMVRVPVIVVDDGGAFIENLTRDAFAVRDGGKRHEVDHFVSDAEPVSVGILLDTSEPMRPYEQDVPAAVARIAHNLRAGDELFVITYGPGVATLHPPTADKDAIVGAMADYAVWDGADRALFDAVDRGLRMLENSDFDKRSLVIIGAGGDTASDVGQLAVQQRIHRTGVTIHAISLSLRSQRVINRASRVNRLQTVAEIAAFTGGLLAQRPRLTGRFGGTGGWMAAAGNDISTYVKHQYLLHYVPQSPPRPGTWREIRIEVAGKHHEIRARSGYMR